MKVVLSDLAQADLEAIGRWIARDSPRRALSFVRELRATCKSLGAHPRRLPVARRVGNRELRRAVHGNYLVYVEIDERQNEVRVVRIVHGAREQDAVFSNGN
jgi:plasmid stabilization system protein ParE